MAVKQLSDGGVDGVSMGQDASDLVSLHGATPIAQATLSTIATAATIATAVASIQAIIAVLQNKGIAG